MSLRIKFNFSLKISKITQKLLPNCVVQIKSKSHEKIINRNVNVDTYLALIDCISEAEEGKSLTLGLNYRKDKTIKQDDIRKKKQKIENKKLEEIEKYFEIKLAGILRDVEETKYLAPQL